MLRYLGSIEILQVGGMDCIVSGGSGGCSIWKTLRHLRGPERETPGNNLSGKGKQW